jgi:hypothetical protein
MTLSLIMARSNSANSPITWNNALLARVVVSKLASQAHGRQDQPWPHVARSDARPWR